MLQGIQDGDMAGKTALVRVDYNVPMHGGEIADDARIRASIPTITHLLDQGARVALVSHLGRPDGRVIPELRLDAVGQRLAQLMGACVRKLDECVGENVAEAIAAGAPGEVFLLENVRFHPGEEANDPDFARQLAAPANVFVNDAFATVHRAHASTLGVAEILPAFAGFLMQREVEALSSLLDNPKRPYLAIVGGKKAGSKLGALQDLVDRVDVILVGGGVAFTFLHARGVEVGDSIVDFTVVDQIHEIVRKADAADVDIVLPSDAVIAQALDEKAETCVRAIDAISAGWAGFDIGPATVRAFGERIREAKTLVWTGPMGAFEFAPFASGTEGVATAIAESDAYSVIGGGETGEAVSKLGREEDVSYISTGGGACLALLRGKQLPALDVLKR